MHCSQTLLLCCSAQYQAFYSRFNGQETHLKKESPSSKCLQRLRALSALQTEHNLLGGLGLLIISKVSLVKGCPRGDSSKAEHCARCISSVSVLSVQTDPCNARQGYIAPRQRQNQQQSVSVTVSISTRTASDRDNNRHHWHACSAGTGPSISKRHGRKSMLGVAHHHHRKTGIVQVTTVTDTPRQR
jgi:hypothetical protein